jgi:hypothetical protein
MARLLVGSIHRIAGIVAFTTIALFWTGTAIVEVFGDGAAVARVKEAILWGMLLLIPAMAAVAATGFRLGGRSIAPAIARKRRRMPFIALNGLLILVPSAFFLAARAAAGQFDLAFYAVQGLELAAGATNIVLMSLSIRDGLALTRKRRRKADAPPSLLAAWPPSARLSEERAHGGDELRA